MTSTLARAVGQVQSLTRGLLDGGLSSTEGRTLLTTRVFDGSPHYRALELFPWEGPWFDLRLPSPPARVLVGGCGAGRELLALVQRGFDVVGHEPATSMVAQARGRVPLSVPVVEMTYQELSRRVLDDGHRALVLDGAESVDAVLFGWGSFGHLLTEEERRRALRAADCLCPRGPILLSFPPAPKRVEGGAYRLGLRLGRRWAGERALAGDSELTQSALVPWAGYLADVTREELEVNAHALGRRLVKDGDDASYPHFSLLPL